jgi:O-succinylbenzoate synthase
VLTVAEYTGILNKLEAIGREARGEISALRVELAKTRESLASCQSRCWVEASGRKQITGYAATFLTAAFGCTLAFVLNTYGCHLGR